MWHSSRGDRTLSGCEAALVAVAIDTMMDALIVHIEVDSDEHDESENCLSDCESGIAVFDCLNACQRIGLLHQLTRYLLTDTSKTLKLSATADAGVAAVFVEIRDQLAIEIDLQDSLSGDDSFYWRRLVVEAGDELLIQSGESDLIPSVGCQRISDWEEVVDVMATAILWDRDFEMVESFLDADPHASDHRRRLLGIDRDYFSDVSPDPRSDAIDAMIRETRRILRVNRR